ncbi:MAG: hypothetical protein M1829_005415 [Trizodia sp. TS-e1964]|nr:MAG: hypothetical protein M1829_005415 [Trizodia sp. TS-e1964]
MATAESTILRPLPRRTFAITPASNESSRPQSPTPDTMPSSPNPCLLDPRYGLDNTPSRTGSIMNLTSSTLYGIYSPTTDTEREDPPTPWGTSSLELNRRMTEGEQPAMPQWERPRTPLRVPLHPTDFRSWALPLVSRTILLFAFGVAYGVIITHLHDNRHVVPVRLELEGVDRYNLVYLIFWGVAGVGLGSLLPLVDSIWEETANSNGLSKNSAEGLHHGGAIKLEDSPSTMASQSGSGLGADWNPVVRGVGAFVGIAFAIVAKITLAINTPSLLDPGAS